MKLLVQNKPNKLTQINYDFLKLNPRISVEMSGSSKVVPTPPTSQEVELPHLTTIPKLQKEHSRLWIGFTPTNFISLLPELKILLGDLADEANNRVSPKILYKTQNLIDRIRSTAKTNKLWWNTPLVNIDIDDNITLEWWYKHKKITLYVCEDTIDFIKVWGADMDNEMEDGTITLNDNLNFLWQWLCE